MNKIINSKQNSKQNSNRPRIALMTNHGYAGVDIPVGGAPDTGGQNFYVNSKALALEELGMEVTIFTRGGFPFFNSNKIREGIEFLSDHVRYVYIPGGGDKFIRKEDIAFALREEAKFLDTFIEKEAELLGIAPWEYYECFDTHYWDAAVIGVFLMERWQDKIVYNFINEFAGGVFQKYASKFADEMRHKYNLSRERFLHLGKMAQQTFPELSPQKILQKLCPETHINYTLTHTESTPLQYRQIEESALLGRALADNMKVDDTKLETLLKHVNRHIWTPHSTSIIKERNYWEKTDESVRWLQFTERNSHEEFVCANTPLFCATSPEIWETLYSYQRQKTEAIFDFPPCLDTKIFKPRQKSELDDVYDFLTEKSGIDQQTLKQSKIIFESSRMDRTKRKDLLLRAFADVAEQTDDTFLFIGGGPEGNSIYNELVDIKGSLPQLKNRAFLLGFIPGDIIAEIFSVPDLFVSTSEMEGFGMSVSQAAASKVAIVSSDFIPFSTQYAKEATSIVHAGDTKGFTNAILELLKDDKKRQENAEKLYNIALKLNWVNTSRDFINCYRNRFNL